MTHDDPIRGSPMISPSIENRHCLLWDLKQYVWLKLRVSSGHPPHHRREVWEGDQHKDVNMWEKKYTWFLMTFNLLNLTINETLTLNIFVNGLHRWPINSFSSTQGEWVSDICNQVPSVMGRRAMLMNRSRRDKMYTYRPGRYALPWTIIEPAQIVLWAHAWGAPANSSLASVMPASFWGLSTNWKSNEYAPVVINRKTSSHILPLTALSTVYWYVCLVVAYFVYLVSSFFHIHIRNLGACAPHLIEMR